MKIVFDIQLGFVLRENWDPIKKKNLSDIENFITEMKWDTVKLWDTITIFFF